MSEDTIKSIEPGVESGERQPFFRRIDLLAAALCFLIAFTVYFFTLAPTVTLEDSGELAVASDYLGVPHPPGYPIWTLATWLFQLLFHWVKYNGHPNPAWGVTLASGFFGAAACGLLALLISRSGSDMVRGVKSITERLGERLENWICLIAGVSGGLLLAFSPVLWSQSTIVEVYSMNAFFLMLVMVFLYMWMLRPREMKWMYALAFSFGLGLTNHQSLMFMGLPLVAAVFLNELKSGRDVIIAAALLLIFVFGLLTPFPWVFIAIAFGLALLLRGMPVFRDFALAGLVMFAMFYTSGWMGQNERMALNWSEGPEFPGFWIWTVMAVLFPAMLALPKNWRRGLSFSILSILALIILRKLLMIKSGLEAPFWELSSGEAAAWGGAALALTLLPIFLSARWRMIALYPAFAVFLILTQLWAKAAGYPELLASEGIVSSGFWLATMTTFIFWLLMVYDLPNGRAVGTTLLLLELGVSFYLMMPIASEQNPPINWGYPRTWKGFMHAVTRGQYEKISPTDNFFKILRDPLYFLRQNYAIIFDWRGCISVVAQFTAPIALLVLAPFFFFGRVARKMRDWLIVSLVAFISMTTIFIVFQFPKLDIQTLFIGRVQYIQAHAIFALWIGYGAIFAIAGIDALSRRKRAVLAASTLLVLLLPAVPVLRNAYDQDLLDLAGSSDQQGHDFGWQFGYYQLMGAEGILEELEPGERASYPNPAYPPAMGANAVFFGGTDPGRFVPTYMIYSADVRPDVFLITQNALADTTYMSVMRDLYGDQIWIPSAEDCNNAFQEYIQKVRSGKLDAGANVSLEEGRISVQGVGGVMHINSFLARDIFEKNRFTQSPEVIEKFRRGEDLAQYGVRTAIVAGQERPVREFYVEESYIISWMYPYLEPHGLIMRLNPQPIKLSEEMVANDQSFWKWYTARLTARSAFKRDLVARKSFSKLRSSLGGLYVHHRRYSDAITAFKQSLELYPLSPEANFRLADTYMRMERWDDAVATLKGFIERDPGNDSAVRYLASIERKIELEKIKSRLEGRQRAGEELGTTDLLQLANVYLGLDEGAKLRVIADKLLGEEDIMPEAYLELARLAAADRDMGLLERSLRMYVDRRPDDHVGWINLAAIELYRQRLPAALTAIRRALDTGGEEARRVILQDKRFQQPLAEHEAFRRLLSRPIRQRPAIDEIPGDLRQLLQ